MHSQPMVEVTILGETFRVSKSVAGFYQAMDDMVMSTMKWLRADEKSIKLHNQVGVDVDFLESIDIEASEADAEFCENTEKYAQAYIQWLLWDRDADDALTALARLIDPSR